MCRRQRTEANVILLSNRLTLQAAERSPRSKNMTLQAAHITQSRPSPSLPYDVIPELFIMKIDNARLGACAPGPLRMKQNLLFSLNQSWIRCLINLTAISRG